MTVHDPDADPYEIAREIALHALERRAHGRAELANHLARRGTDPEIIERVLDRFTEVGLLDDVTYARQLVESRYRVRGMSKRALRLELRRRGLADHIVLAAVDQLDSCDETRAAHGFAERRVRAMSGLPSEVALRRLASALTRRGFSGELAWQAAQAAVSAAGLIDDNMAMPDSPEC